MLTVISDMHNPVAVLELPDGADVLALREEYEAVMGPGPNPYCYEADPERQYEWVDRIKAREQFLTLKYGGDPAGDGTTQFGAVTFANWLVREKGARAHPFTRYCMAEFD